MASVAQMTGTLIDSGCKHILPVRVSMDTMMCMAKEPDQNSFLREKFRFCAHKNDLLLCVNKALCAAGRGRLTKTAAYPNIISTLGDVAPHVRLAIALYYHDPTKYHPAGAVQADVQALFNAVAVNTKTAGFPGIEMPGRTTPEFSAWEDRVKRHITGIPNFTFMGFSLGLGYAHPSSGDTVVSSMIGGMISVQNGAFDLCTGDYVMWYWEFERPFFDKDGWRIDNADESELLLTRDERERQTMHLRQNGEIHIGNEHHEGKKNIAYPKPFVHRWDKPELGALDRLRVFGKCVSNARAFDVVDLMVCTQSV